MRRRIKLTRWDLEPHRARFDAKVKKITNGCWLWIGPMSQHADAREGCGPEFGVTLAGQRRITNLRANRAALYYYSGELPPEGADVVRRCGNMRCVNPAHMEVRDDT